MTDPTDMVPGGGTPPGLHDPHTGMTVHEGSVIELRKGYGGSVITAFARLEGRPVRIGLVGLRIEGAHPSRHQRQRHYREWRQ